MKKFYSVAALLFAATSIFAQSKITYSQNGLNIGDVRPMIQIDHLDQGNGGANQYWDFSSAKEVKSMTIAQNENVATAIGNLDLTSRNTLLACDEGGEKTTYFEITPSEKKYWGLKTGGVTISFNEPIVDLKFPFSYLESVSGTMDGTYSDMVSSNSITGTYSTTADAWGTLVLPDGKQYENVLRVKVEKNYLQPSGNSNYTIHTIRYQYFAPGLRYPVLIVLENDVKSDCNCACGNYNTTSAFYLPASDNKVVDNVVAEAKVGSALNHVSVNVVPNPVSDNMTALVNSSIEDEAEISVLDAAGRVIKDFGKYNLISGKNSVSLQVNDLIPGNYFLRVNVGGVNYAKSIIKK